MENLERFGSFPLMNAGLFEHFKVLTKRFYRLSWRLSTTMHETVEKLKSALDSLQRPEGKVNGVVAGASLLTKRRCVDDGGGFFVRNGVRLFLRKVSEEPGRPEASMPAECWLGRVVGELLSVGLLSSFANCVREWRCVDRYVCSTVMCEWCL